MVFNIVQRVVFLISTAKCTGTVHTVQKIASEFGAKNSINHYSSFQSLFRGDVVESLIEVWWFSNEDPNTMGNDYSLSTSNIHKRNILSFPIFPYRQRLPSI